MTSSSRGVDEQGPSEGSAASEPAALFTRTERAHSKQRPRRFSPGQSEGATAVACVSDRPSPQTLSYGEASASTADPVASRTERRSGVLGKFRNEQSRHYPSGASIPKGLIKTLDQAPESLRILRSGSRKDGGR